jgi:hypothetical protein
MSWGIAAQPDMNTTDMNAKTADNRFIIVSPSLRLPTPEGSRCKHICLNCSNHGSYDSTNRYKT